MFVSIWIFLPVLLVVFTVVNGICPLQMRLRVSLDVLVVTYLLQIVLEKKHNRQPRYSAQTVGILFVILHVVLPLIPSVI